jgi:type I restriction enzyme R subunit
MRSALVNENSDLFSENNKYIMQITGDNDEGKRELDNFINPSETYPVIATTSKLMTTGVDAQTCKLIVLDSNIASMTEFKQIIGRGTRINEEFGKQYFTIMDFRNITHLFADKDFDGDPVMIKDVTEEDDLAGIEDESNDEPIIDIETGEEVDLPEPPEITGGGEIEEPPRKKVRVNGVLVKVVNERVQYLGEDGKIITESFKAYTKGNINKQYATLTDFLKKWNSENKKTTIVEALEEQGIFFDILREEVGQDFDPFDLICHIAFEQPPLTRKERAQQVKKRNYFSEYGEKAQAVIQSLLEKYADDGLLTIESIEVLKLNPVNQHGSPIEIIKAFGGKADYLEALAELEQELYKAA